MISLRGFLTSIAPGTAMLAFVCSAALGGCGGNPDLNPRIRGSKNQRASLLTLAAREAALIKDSDARLTRQLNITDLLLQKSSVHAAKETLQQARKTLGEAGEKLNTHARLSGWVSLSQLSRRAKDSAGAESASDHAVRLLHKIEDPAERCQYVMGVANELNHVRGPARAAELLAEAGPWPREIDSIPGRRRALLAFAVTLFNLDHYEKGIKVLRNDDKPEWRSDVLAKLAMRAEYRSGHRNSVLSRSTSVQESKFDGMVQTQSYGKSLKFERVFKGQSKSQTK